MERGHLSSDLRFLAGVVSAWALAVWLESGVLWPGGVCQQGCTASRVGSGGALVSFGGLAMRGDADRLTSPLQHRVGLGEAAWPSVVASASGPDWSRVWRQRLCARQRLALVAECARADSDIQLRLWLAAVCCSRQGVARFLVSYRRG